MIFPTIKFVDKMPEEKNVAVLGENYDHEKCYLLGCYTRSIKEILILRGRGFKETIFTIWHELSHWVIDLVFYVPVKDIVNRWFDKHFTSKKF